jgi:hypothetical protein
LLGLAVSRVRETEALVGFMVGIVAMIAIIFGVWNTADGNWVFLFQPSEAIRAELGLTALAWPWYTAIGAVITMLVGSLLSIRHR